MNEKLKDQDILLVKEPESEKLKVVAGVDKNGKMKTVFPLMENQPDFMLFDKHSNGLENFFSNFMHQYKDPTHFGFFRMPMEEFERNPKIVDDFGALAQYKVSPEDFLKSKQQQEQPQQQTGGYKSIDPDRIDWAQFEKMGITRESLEKSKALEPMLNFSKSPGLIPIVIKVDDMTIRTDARLSLKELPDGRIVPNIHAIQKEPQLDRPFYGNTFTDEDKKALSETGHLGRLIDLKIPGKEDVKAFVSIDRLTNDIIACRADKIRIPNEINGVQLTEQQKKELSEGKGVYVEGMTSKNGKNFNATLQINADKRGIEFQFGNKLKESQQQGNTQTEPADKALRVPNKLLGRDISPEEKAKLKEGQTVYMEGFTDKKGQPFNAYVKPDFKEGRFRFISPEKYEKQQVTPDNASQTQVAINSDGKTNEATKHTNEPLRQGQVEPTQQQRQETEQRQQNKPKGMRM